MTPDFLLLADGADVTATIRDRLISLTVHDEDGLTSDRLSLVLDDRDRRIAIPPTEARLELSLGFRETGLTRIGSYVVDLPSGDGPPDTMRIQAKAPDMTGGIRAPKTRSWPRATLGGIVRAVAGEAGLEPVVGADIAATAYPMVAQTAESDLHLITRLARVLDATAKPADGRLVVTRRDGRTATGEALPAAPILRDRMERYNWSLGARGRYKSVTAEWSEPDTATLHKITVGSGAPERRLRHPFGSEDEAKRAARAALKQSERNTTVRCELSVACPYRVVRFES